MADFSKLPPGAKAHFTPFKSSIQDTALSKLKQLVEIAPIAPETYENLRENRQYGVTRKWMIDAQKYWTSDWSWRDIEAHFNSFPNYTVPIKARDGETYTVHFLALFSTRQDAKPIACYHGWPGSVFEFLPFVTAIRERWPAPEDLPWHVVVPSLVGYSFSSGPSKTVEWTMEDLAYVMDEVMVALGLQGYIAHGGDIGSYVSRILSVKHGACRALHLNMCVMKEPPASTFDPKDVTDTEKRQYKRLLDFTTFGNAYAKEHGTKGGTIGLVLSSSPLALLGWIGEKFLAWSDEDISLKDIVDSVSLYWLTETFPRCIYPYMNTSGKGEKSASFHSLSEFYCEKPMGFSYFPMELGPVPIAWVKTTGNLIWYKRHTSGGHFPALEKPKELVQDLVDFIEKLDG